MHDKKIDRTTTGKGYPADYTLEELRQFRLKSGFSGHKTAHLIPTLEEVMSLCKGKILVNIDKGYDYFKDVYAVLKETGTVQQCIIKSRTSLMNKSRLKTVMYWIKGNLHAYCTTS